MKEYLIHVILILIFVSLLSYFGIEDIILFRFTITTIGLLIFKQLIDIKNKL